MLKLRCKYLVYVQYFFRKDLIPMNEEALTLSDKSRLNLKIWFMLHSRMDFLKQFQKFSANSYLFSKR